MSGKDTETPEPGTAPEGSSAGHSAGRSAGCAAHGGRPSPGTVAAVRIRPARADDARTLSDLALRSKAHWGYPAEFLTACVPDLRIRPEDVSARRAVIAERAGPDGGSAPVVGFATLDGVPPDGTLGMLFVEPHAIGGGVGRRLYEHVLGEASRLGFTRLMIEADPNAVGFYRRMGARPVDTARTLPILMARPDRAPEPSWIRAWAGPGSAQTGSVQIGNVAEFNAGCAGEPARRRRYAGPGRHTRRDRHAAPDHYSCLALFGSPLPSVVVLPEAVDDHWIGMLADVLGWNEDGHTVTVHSGVAPDGRTSEAILADRPLLDHLTGLAATGARLLPWGRTAAFDRILPSPEGVLPAIRRYESKRGAHTLFRTLAADHPGISVAAQRVAGSRRALRRALRQATRHAALTRSPLVLKREYGVGGSGTLIVTDVRALRRAAATARRWLRDGPGAVLVEECVRGSGPFRDLTFDAVVDSAGIVHPVGTGRMEVEGASYQGVTVGPGVLPTALAETATAFGTAVGRALAADGYRGWFDVDFVTGETGLLHPTEINLRLTGPAAAFNIQARLDHVRGGRHFVRTLDRLPLGARLPPAALREHLTELAQECAALGATVLATIPTAAFEPVPYVGVAIAARTAGALDEAEATVRRGNEQLATMFAGLSGSGSTGGGAGSAAAPRSLSRFFSG